MTIWPAPHNNIKVSPPLKKKHQPQQKKYVSLSVMMLGQYTVPAEKQNILNTAP
jgi:hypothetical protein